MYFASNITTKNNNRSDEKTNPTLSLNKKASLFYAQEFEG